MREVPCGSVSVTRSVPGWSCGWWRKWVVVIESWLFGFLALVFKGVVDGSKLYCIIWKKVLELLPFPDRSLIAASRLANSVFAAGYISFRQCRTWTQRWKLYMLLSRTAGLSDMELERCATAAGKMTVNPDCGRNRVRWRWLSPWMM